jgi:hypothetical protein
MEKKKFPRQVKRKGGKRGLCSGGVWLVGVRSFAFPRAAHGFGGRVELTQWRECKARASRERGDLVRARAQRLSPSREWGLMLGRELGRDAARVGEGNTGIAGGGNLDAKCRALIETAGGPSLACGRLVPWRPGVTGPPSVEAHKPAVRAPSSRGSGWFTSERSLSIPR